MKRTLLLLTIGIALLQGTALHAQRIAFVNTRYILDNMPEYESAQKGIGSVLQRNGRRRSMSAMCRSSACAMLTTRRRSC
jgi:Skp family chaperone for outer membrane proteins